ncbi:MAG: hypothetical protein KTR25_21075 [Myxococcales bacterium]|nr:hypothetical protein [Myxococcales bacterium]
MRNNWITPGIVAVVSLGMLLTFLGSAQAADEVGVTIEIMKASKEKTGFQGQSKRYKSQISRFGFAGARLMDKVTALGRSVGESVELKFRDGGGPVQMVKVKVLSSSAQSTKLLVHIPAYRFRTETTHKNNGTFVVFVPKKELFLAVRPSRQ